MYLLTWKNPALAGKTDIQVPVGSVVTSAASLQFTGKGAANYGKIQQENFMRLLENFADGTAPLHPTVGQFWYDTSNAILKICSNASPLVWKSLAGIQVTSASDPTPSPASNGDMWYKRTGSGSGIFYVYTGLGRFPETTSTIGGWCQIWPNIEITAGREEYNYVLGLIRSLIGDVSFGGSGAEGRAITNLPSLTLLDADLQAKWTAATPNDTNVVLNYSGESSPLSELLVDPTSNDWDVLLAAAKYAVNRLELPIGFAQDISPVPFVTDGLQAPTSLTSLPTSDIRYPSLERRSNRRFGLITLVRLYTETINVLNAAVSTKYSIKGINGASGTNTTFDSTTSIKTQGTFSAAMAGASGGTINLGFIFANADSMSRFLNAGGAIQVTVSHVPGGSGTAADTNLKTLTDQKGVFRITGDKTRTFGNSAPLYLATTPVNVGIVGSAPAGTTLVTHTLSGASVAAKASSGNVAGRFDIGFTYAGGAAMQGTLTFKYEVIYFNETYLNPSATAVYPLPNNYASGNMTSSGPVMA